MNRASKTDIAGARRLTLGDQSIRLVLALSVVPIGAGPPRWRLVLPGHREMRRLETPYSALCSVPASSVYAASSVSLGRISVAVWVFVRITGFFLLSGAYVNHTLAL